jgi:hypothetical protein
LSERYALYYAFVLLAICFISVETAAAQDIISGSQSSEIWVFEGKKVNRGKSPAAKSKNYTAVATKKTTTPLPLLPQAKTSRLKVETISEGRSKNQTQAEYETKAESKAPPSNNYPATSVNGSVRLKQDNRGATGVLIEAVRIDTREMIDSTETDSTGEFKFKKLPTGTAIMFLVSSPKIKPYIFKADIEAGMKNLEFTVFPH